MVITVEREPSVVTLTYEVRDGEHMNRTMNGSPPTSGYFPQRLNICTFVMGELMEHQVKTNKIDKARRVASALSASPSFYLWASFLGFDKNTL